MAFINQFPYSDFHELNLDWLIKQTKESLEAIKDLQEKMSEIEIMTKDQIESMINIAIDNNNVDLYNRLSDLYNQITNEYHAYVLDQINLLTIYINNQDIYYNELAQTYAAQALNSAKTYTDEQVLNYTMMINPITGTYEDVRDVVTDIVNYFHTENSLTAGEYDALDLTASAYDAYDLTAYEYDFNGKNLLV